MGSMSEAKHVYMAINAVAEQMAREGISKDRVADIPGSRYRFRGVDDVMNALAPKLAAAKLCILPRVLDRSVTERTNKSGTIMSYVVLTVEFDLVSAVDGSCHTVRTMGEAMDSSDKATNKAMSAAYKYACFQAFAIPTEGDNDSENNHHEPMAERKSGTAVVTAKKAERDENEEALAKLLTGAGNVDQLAKAAITVEKERQANKLSQAAVQRLRQVYAQKVDELKRAS